MARSYFLNGETMVHVAGRSIQTMTQLGLAVDSVEIAPRYVHQDVIVDDFGPEVPADVLSMLAEVYVRMTLVHFDQAVLGHCMDATLGATAGLLNLSDSFGTGRAGRPMGAARAVGVVPNHFMRLYLQSARGNLPWRFYAAYLDGRPFIFPVGTKHSLVQINWRCLPFQVPRSADNYEVLSANAVIYDHVLST